MNREGGDIGGRWTRMDEGTNLDWSAGVLQSPVSIRRQRDHHHWRR